MPTTLDIQGLDPSLEGITFSLTGDVGQKLGRNIRRNNQEFRDEFTALGISEDTPFQLRVENGNREQQSQQNNLLAQLLGSRQIQPPSTPDFFQTPEGTFRRSDGGFIFEEDPEKKKLRVQREGLITQFLTQIGEGISPERVAQINEKADLIQDRLFERSERVLSQSERQRGREGSALDDSMINLANETAQQAELFAEDLFARDRDATLNALNAVQAGQNAASGLALQAQGLAANDAFARQSLETSAGQGLLGTLLGSQATNRQLALQERGLTENLQLQSLQRRDAERAQEKSKFGDLARVGGTILGGPIGGMVAGGLFGRKTAPRANLISSPSGYMNL